MLIRYYPLFLLFLAYIFNFSVEYTIYVNLLEDVLTKAIKPILDVLTNVYHSLAKKNVNVDSDMIDMRLYLTMEKKHCNFSKLGIPPKSSQTHKYLFQ